MKNSAFNTFKNFVYDHLPTSDEAKIGKLPNVSDNSNLGHILRNTNL